MDIKRRPLLHWGLAGLLAPLPGGTRADAALKVFGDDHYVPLSHLQDGRPQGVLVELLRAAEPGLGQRFDIELTAWNRAMSLAEQARGGLVGVSYNKRRAAWLDFSLPLYNDDIHLVVRKDRAFAATRLEDLRGKLIGIGNGVSYGDELEAALTGKLFRVTRDWGIQRRLRIVLAGKVDGAFIGNGTVGFDAALRAEADLWARRGELLLLPTPLLRDRLHLGFAKSLRQQALLERFNAALAALKLLPATAT